MLHELKIKVEIALIADLSWSESVIRFYTKLNFFIKTGLSLLPFSYVLSVPVIALNILSRLKKNNRLPPIKN